MNRLYKRGVGRKTGLAPGTLVYVGEQVPSPAVLTVMEFDAERSMEASLVTVDDALPFRESPAVTWLNVAGLTDVAVVERLCGRYGVHHLVQEDILHTDQRPKAEVYDDHIYIVVKMIRFPDDTAELDIEQVSLILGRNFVITFQEKEGDVFEPVRERIRSGKGKVRMSGADYLAYCLMDAVVDGYFLTLERIGEGMEEIENEVLDAAHDSLASSIHMLKRELVILRKAVWPLREGIGTLMRDSSTLVDAGTLPYLRDLYDHTIAVMDTIESFRDVASGLLDLYLSSVSNRMNQVMKVLTVIATIFIPLTFIAGVYGMNFHHMPELSLPWAYPAVLGLCVLIALFMVMVFRRKGWF